MMLYPIILSQNAKLALLERMKNEITSKAVDDDAAKKRKRKRGSTNTTSDENGGGGGDDDDDDHGAQEGMVPAVPKPPSMKSIATSIVRSRVLVGERIKIYICGVLHFIRYVHFSFVAIVYIILLLWPCLPFFHFVAYYN